MNDHRFETHKLLWRGITIEVTYEAHWLRREGLYCPCHLTLKTIERERYPLPVTETGYLSHFTDPVLVAEAGGPLAYVTAELEATAMSKRWQQQEAERRQLSLF